MSNHSDVTLRWPGALRRQIKTRGRRKVNVRGGGGGMKSKTHVTDQRGDGGPGPGWGQIYRLAAGGGEDKKPKNVRVYARVVRSSEEGGSFNGRHQTK